MTKFQDLVAKNPDLKQQWQQYQQQSKSQSGQSGQPGQQSQSGSGQSRQSRPDWEGFRKHLKDQGKADPGEEPDDLETAAQSM